MTEGKAGERVTYQIKVQGKLDERWSEWFSGLTITVESESPPVTALVGDIDQAALRGILAKIWDLNLALVSVNPFGEGKNETAPVSDARRLSHGFWII
ncbi:MAG: hypothetical protein JXA14_12125 [Anaerolineae bacterium]|nr:hypothetical protein [Anaerolineae bacterium]